jgi:hypothetical protein
MRSKKSCLLFSLVLALLVLALILPASALGASESKPTAWCSLGLNSANRSPYGQVSAWSIEARQLPGGTVGREVMNWAVGQTFPQGHHLTRDVVRSEFVETGPGTYQATVVFHWQGGVFDYLSPTGHVYHRFLLIDRPGSAWDHVELWANPYSPDWPVGMGLELFNVDMARGVQVVVR